jgi:hypothetical protein
MKLNARETTVAIAAIKTYLHVLTGNVPAAFTPLVRHLVAHAEEAKVQEAYRSGMSDLPEAREAMRQVMQYLAPGQPSINDPAVPEPARVADRLVERIVPDEDVTLTDQEDRVLWEALDTYMRVHLGQGESVMEPLIMRLFVAQDKAVFPADLHIVRDGMLKVSRLLTGSSSGGPGIFNRGVSNDARIAHRLRCKLRGDTLGLRLTDENGNPTN